MIAYIEIKRLIAFFENHVGLLYLWSPIVHLYPCEHRVAATNNPFKYDRSNMLSSHPVILSHSPFQILQRYCSSSQTDSQLVSQSVRRTEITHRDNDLTSSPYVQERLIATVRIKRIGRRILPKLTPMISTMIAMVDPIITG